MPTYSFNLFYTLDGNVSESIRLFNLQAADQLTLRATTINVIDFDALPLGFGEGESEAVFSQWPTPPNLPGDIGSTTFGGTVNGLNNLIVGNPSHTWLEVDDYQATRTYAANGTFTHTDNVPANFSGSWNSNQAIYLSLYSPYAGSLNNTPDYVAVHVELTTNRPKPDVPQQFTPEQKAQFLADAQVIDHMTDSLKALSSSLDPLSAPIAGLNWLIDEYMKVAEPTMHPASATAETMPLVLQVADKLTEKLPGVIDPASLTLGVATFFTSRMSDLLKYLGTQDPPDLNYNQVLDFPQNGFTPITGVSTTGNALLQHLYNMVGDLTELVAATERYQGAAFANDATAKALQQTAFNTALSAYNTERGAVSQALTDFLADAAPADTTFASDTSLTDAATFLQGLKSGITGDPVLNEFVDGMITAFLPTPDSLDSKGNPIAGSGAADHAALISAIQTALADPGSASQLDNFAPLQLLGDFLPQVESDLANATPTTLTGSVLQALGDAASGILLSVPHVTAVSTNPSVGNLNAGKIVGIEIDMNQALKVSGGPTLTLNDGGTATFDAAHSDLGNGVLAFSYKVLAGQNTPAATNLEISAVNGTVTDTTGDAADFSGAENKDLGLVIDTKAPAVGAIAVTAGTMPANNALGLGQSIAIDVTLSPAENLLISNGAATLKLSDGGTATLDLPNSDIPHGVLEFDYTALSGQNTALNTTLKVTSLSLNGSTITDLAGNALVVTGAANKDLGIMVDTTAPAVKVALTSDTGISKTDKITSSAELTGSGDPNTTVTIMEGVTLLGTTTSDSKGAWTFTPSLSAGAHTITAKETDAASNTGQASITFTLDKTAPGLDNPKITLLGAAADGNIGAGQTLLFDVNFNEAITSTGAMSLILGGGYGSALFDAKDSDLAHGHAAFSVLIPTGKAQGALSTTGVNTTDGFADLAGNGMDVLGITNALKSVSLGVQVDTIAPTVSPNGVTSNPGPGMLVPSGGINGQPVEIDVAISEPVVVKNGDNNGLTLKLSDGGVATYDSADSTATKLVFHYTPAAGQNTGDLVVSGMVLGKTTAVTDLAGNALVLTGAANQDLGVKIDTNAPTVTAIAKSTTPAGLTKLAAGNHVLIDVTLKDATLGDHLTISGTPGDPGSTAALVMNDRGKAVFESSSAGPAGTTILHFDYTVGTESTTDLKVVGFNFDKGTITDDAGNAAVLPANFAAADFKMPVNVFSWINKLGGSWDSLASTDWSPQPGTPIGTADSGATALIAVATSAPVVVQTEDHGVAMLGVIKGATLELKDHKFTVGNGAGSATSSNAGTIKVDGGAEFHINAPSFSNIKGGAITLGSADLYVGDIVNPITLALSGGGTVTMLGSAEIGAGSAGTVLENVDNLINGAGTIGDDHLAFKNDAKGTVSGDGLTIDASTNNALNFGVLKGITANGLAIDGTIANYNLMEALGGEALLTLNGEVDNQFPVGGKVAGSIVSSGPDALVDFNGVTVRGGTITVMTGAAAEIADASTFQSLVGNALTINNAGTMTLNSGVHLAIGGTVTLTGKGTFHFNNANSIVVTNGSAATFVNQGNTIDGNGGFDDPLLTVDNQVGIIAAMLADGKTTNEATLSGRMVNESVTQSATGQILSAANGHVMLDGAGGATDVTGGKLIGAATTSNITLQNDVNLTNVAVSNAGEMDISGTAAFSGGSFVNTGFVSIDAAAVTFTTPVTNTGTGTVAVGGGVNGLMDISDAGQAVFAGTVGGTGTIRLDDVSSAEFQAAATPNVAFGQGAAATLILDHTFGATAFKGVISGFAGAQGSAGIDHFFAFGDSGIDSGWFPNAIADNGIVNNPDGTGSNARDGLIQNAVTAHGTGTPVGSGSMDSQILASNFGITIVSANDDSVGPNSDINYAIAGALTVEDAGGGNYNTPSGPGTDPGNNGWGNLNPNHALDSTVVQIENYLGDFTVDPNAIYLIGSGANDKTFALDTTTGLGNDSTAQQQAYLMHQGDALATEVEALVTAGAQHVVLHGGFTGSVLLGTELIAKLTADGLVAGQDYVTVDIPTLKSAVAANPTKFGFTAATVNPGTSGTNFAAQSSAFQLQSKASPPNTSVWGQWGAPTGTPSPNTAYLTRPNSEYTSFYSDNEHFSTQGQQILANFDLAQLFAAGALQQDAIDLKDITYGLATTFASFTGTAAGGTLTVTDGTNTASLKLAGDYRGVDFVTVDDGHGGTGVIEGAAGSALGAGGTATDVGSLIGGHNAFFTHYAGAITAGMFYAAIDYTVNKSVTLSGDGTKDAQHPAGQITLVTAENIVSDGVHAVTLTNGEAIDGGGVIGDSLMTLVNKGVIDANDTANGMLIHTPGHAVANTGTIEATGGGWLMIQDTTITDTGAGSVQATGTGLLGSTTINSHIDLDNATITGGTVTVGASTFLTAVHGSTATVTAAVVDNGTLEALNNYTDSNSVTHTSHLTINGAVTGGGGALIGLGGVIEFGVSSSANVKFDKFSTTDHGTLMLDKATSVTSQFTGTITGFHINDDIDLGAIGFTDGDVNISDQASFNAGVLTVHDNSGHSINLTFTDASITSLNNIHIQNHNGHVDLLHV